MSVLRFGVRVARKTAVKGNAVLRKASRLADKVETKATRILDGVDYSVQINDEVLFEKLYYSSMPYMLPIHASMPAVGSEPTVTLLIPSLDGASFFGGTATALVVAAKIALHQHRKLRIVQTLKTGHPGDLGVFFASEGITFPSEHIQVISVADRAYNRYGYVSMHSDDIFVASAWWDAQALSQMPLGRKFIYLIQDFEPIFYNNSDQYVLAEETYKTDKFIPLCNTKLMADFMKSRNYSAFEGEVGYFEPAVSRADTGYQIEKKPGEKKILFLYGRPNVHRNLFFTALSAIDYAFKADFLNKNEWDVVMAGQSKMADIKLSSGVVVKNNGKMSMKDYVSFSKSIDLAVSPMMAPHPNYPTLEFASIGTTVVTTKYANKQKLDNYSNNIIISDIGVESLAGAIKLAAEVPFSDRIDNAKHSTINTSWDESLAKVIDRLVDRS